MEWAGGGTLVGILQGWASRGAGLEEAESHAEWLGISANHVEPCQWVQIHLVNYVEGYLDSIGSLLFDLQRTVLLMREIGWKQQEILKELDEYYEMFQ